MDVLFSRTVVNFHAAINRDTTSPFEEKDHAGGTHWLHVPGKILNLPKS